MLLRLAFFVALSASLARAWDSPLPFAQGPGHRGFARRFRQSRRGGLRRRLALEPGLGGMGRRPDARQRLWSVQQQSPGWAAGFRYWEGAGPYLTRFDLAGAWNALGYFTFGLRPAYVWDGLGPDHLLLDAGLDFRPLPQLLLGAWTENLATAGDERRTHRLAASARPFAGFGAGGPTWIWGTVSSAKARGNTAVTCSASSPFRRAADGSPMGPGARGR